LASGWARALRSASVMSIHTGKSVLTPVTCAPSIVIGLRRARSTLMSNGTSGGASIGGGWASDPGGGGWNKQAGQPSGRGPPPPHARHTITGAVDRIPVLDGRRWSNQLRVVAPPSRLARTRGRCGVTVRTVAVMAVGPIRGAVRASAVHRAADGIERGQRV